MKRKRHSQPRLKDVNREPTFTALIPELAVHAAEVARLYGVTRSWVIAQTYAKGAQLPWPRECDYRLAERKKR